MPVTAEGTRPTHRGFLKRNPDVLASISAQAKTAAQSCCQRQCDPLHSLNDSKRTGLLGGRQWRSDQIHRVAAHLPKTHWSMAECVGQRHPGASGNESGAPTADRSPGTWPQAKCAASMSMGFPIRHRQADKVQFGYRRANWCEAVVSKGARAGTMGAGVHLLAGSFDSGPKLDAGRDQLSLLPSHPSQRWL